jgi:hypothetical protein
MSPSLTAIDTIVPATPAFTVLNSFMTSIMQTGIVGARRACRPRHKPAPSATARDKIGRASAHLIAIVPASAFGEADDGAAMAVFDLLQAGADESRGRGAFEHHAAAVLTAGSRSKTAPVLRQALCARGA